METLFLLAFLSGCIGAGASFIHFCMGNPSGGDYVPGKIFSFYGKLVSRKFVEFHQANPKKLNYYMALGACFTCFATWVSMIAWAVCCLAFGLSFWWVLLCTPITVYLGKIMEI